MQQAAADDFAANQIAELELEADGEQQQEHAQMRQVIENDAVVTGHAHVVARCGQREAGTEVADQRRQADEAGKQPEGESEGNPAGFNHGAASGVEGGRGILMGRRRLGSVGSDIPCGNLLVRRRGSGVAVPQR